MKTLSILKFTIISTIIAFTSCKKEHVPNADNQIPASDLKLAGMLTDFKARGESHLKSGTEMDIDSAIWYIGAATNFTYGDGARATEKTWTDSIFITLPITNGKITEAEVYNKYLEVIDNLRAKYQAKNEENKQLIAASVTTHSVNSTEVVCKVIGVFAFGFPTNIPCTFTTNDSYCYWYYWQNHAICAGNTGSTAFTDAAIETQKRIMNCRAIPYGNYWYEPLPNNTGTITINDPSQYPIDTTSDPTNNRYAHLYWNSSKLNNPDINGCINPGDLNFYLSKTKELIYKDTENNGIRPVGSSFINISMWGDIVPVYPNNYIYEHKAIVYYGILHVTPFLYCDLPQ